LRTAAKELAAKSGVPANMTFRDLDM